MANLFIKGIEVPEKSYLDNNFFTQSYINTNYYTNSYINNTFLTKTDANSNFLNKTNRTSYMPTGDYNPATKKYVDDCIAAINQLHFEIVEELPQVGEPTIIYMILADDGEGEDYYDEYIYINDTWEKIGSTRIDLTPYATIEYVDNYGSNISAYAWDGSTSGSAALALFQKVINDHKAGKTVLLITPKTLDWNYFTNESTIHILRAEDQIYGSGNNRSISMVGYTRISYSKNNSYSGLNFSLNNVKIYLDNQDIVTRIETSGSGQEMNCISPTLTYSTPFIPTHPGHPTTKKYVDECIAPIYDRLAEVDIQYSEMPEEASDGTILQYIGETTDEYTNGGFYKSLGEQYKELSSITTLSGYPSQVKLPDTYNFSLDGNKMEFKFAMTGRVSGNQTLMFRNYPFSIYLVRSNSYYWIYGGDDSALDFDASYVADEIHTLIINDGPNYDAYWDNTLMDSGIVENTEEYSRIFKGDPYAVAATGTFYYLKVWDHDTNELIHNLIPAQRESDSAYGIYDTVTHEFYIWEEVVSGYMEVGDYTSNVYQITNWIPLIYTAEDVYTKTEIDEGYASIDYVDNKTGYYTCSITHAFNETSNQMYLRQASELNSIAQAVTNAYQNGEHVLHLKLNWTNGVEFLTFTQKDLQQKPTGMALYWFATNGYPRLFYIAGSWSGNTFTCNNETRIECYGTSAFGFGDNSLFRYGVQYRDVLTKNNTTAFTPTGDYNPATKKYVDDNINNIRIPTMVVENHSELDENFWFDYTYGVTLSQTVRNKLSAVINECKQLYAPEATNLVGVPFSFVVKYNTTQIIPGIITVYNSGSLVDDEDTIQLQWTVFNQGNFYNGKLDLDCEWVDGVCTVTTEWTGEGNRYTKCLVGNNEVLVRGNQQYYEPFYDYDPATKKYVDMQKPVWDLTNHGYVLNIWTDGCSLNNNDKQALSKILSDYQAKHQSLVGLSFDVIANTNHISKINMTYTGGTSSSSGPGFIVIADDSPEFMVSAMYIDGTWNLDTFTCTLTYFRPFQWGQYKYLNYDSVLQRNTSASIWGQHTYTTLPKSSVVPTSDEHFVNKKYVDDSISNKIWIGTQAEYDILGTYSDDTLYFIKETQQTSY